eukprot:TRINITY_DN7067_c0_g1_i3.p1 TRINITY_DN7067_c0_g1~~TRINITY_DN7067_c0_g1_i3.p1  ORF type:complete len:428 (+),score=74.34 TRINITY_DN7067_c0_g1_i3:157-1440(+)
MASRRVAVVGLGSVNPLATSPAQTWKLLCQGASGIRPINDYETYSKLRIPSLVAAEVQTHLDESDISFEQKWKHALPSRATPRGIQFGMVSAFQALDRAQLLSSDSPATLNDYHDPGRVGVAIGTGISGVHELLDNHDTLNTRGYRRVSPYLIPNSLVNMTAGLVSMHYNLQGPNHAVSTACSTGAHAIGDAFRMIKHGYADVMVCGGTDACISPLVVAGFARAKALATKFNDDPEAASRPFDADRCGFVIGEGAAVLVLEEWDSAVARGAPIMAEVAGYGMSGDAHHITSPPESGRGAIACMQQALAEADVLPSEVDYVNAHATSTPVGDEIEARAIAQATRPDVLVSATKGATGHLLGAAGALEAMLTIQSLAVQAVPPILNLHNPIETTLRLPTVTTPAEINVGLSNSFGFGGTNASLCFKRAG